MRRGTEVAKAYVSITADGSGINEEIVDSVDAAGPGVEKAGREHGERYGSGFSDGLEPEFSHAADNIGREFNRRMETTGRDNGETYGTSFDKSLKKMAKKIGQNVGNSIGKGIESQMWASMKRIELMLEAQIGELTRKVSGNLGGGGGGGGGKPPAPGGNAFPMPEFDDRRWAEALRMQRDFLARSEAMSIAFEKKFTAARVKMREDSDKAILKFEADLVRDQQKLYDKAAKEAAARDKEAMARDKEMWRLRNISAKAHFKYLADLERGKTDERGVDIKRTPTIKAPDLGGMIGGLFGAGSRNNFFNFLGSSIGNVISMATKLQKVLAPMLTRLASSAGMGSRLASGFGAVGASGIAAAAAIVILVAAMSALVSVASALLALVIALASTIASALVGAVLILGGAFAAAAAAGGLLTAAFLSMTDAQKKMLSTAFKPLKAELVGLGQLMIRDMIPHFKTWSSNLQDAIALAGPAAKVMGEAFGEAGNRLTKSLSGPGFRLFSEQLAVYLPSIVKRMTGALGGFMNGLSGVFAALLPFVQQFAGWLNRAAESFSDWATSAEGQDAITDFVERAVESIESLWGFVTQFVGFISDVLFSKDSQKAGNSLFDSLADSFEGFRKKLDKAIKNGDLKKWFDDAIKFGGKMKNVIIELKDTFVKLYNDGTLEAVGDGLDTVAEAIKDTNKVLGPLVRYLGKVLPPAAQAAEDAINGITFFGLLGHLDTVIGKIGDLINLLSKIPGGPDSSGLGGGSGGGGGSWGSDSEGSGFEGGGGGGSGGGSGSGSGGGGFQGGGGGRVMTAAALRLLNRTTDGGGGGGDGGTKTDWAQHLIDLGNAAMDSNDSDSGSGSGSGSGGGKGGKGKKKHKWKNPYIEFANSLIKEGPSVARQLASAMKAMAVQANRALAQAAKALDLADARSILTSQMEEFRQTGRNGVALAQDALNSAAESLKSATGPKEAQKALKQVHKAQRDLEQAIKNQNRLNKLAERIGKQRVQNNRGALSAIGDVATVESIKQLGQVQNKTLADFAASRAKAAVLIESANAQLADAISLRDNFDKQISDSIKGFGALTTAQAQVIDGVEQALTANDITSNLQTRLEQIKKFQANLRILLAQGLSNDAYKQILEQGVAEGGTFAQALIDGGIGAITDTNALVGQINGIADELGLETSSRLYQAGVDAAQGLVDGLTSLSAELDAAATALGNRIAAAVKKALGIKSPSTVMIGAMGHVGDGVVVGLDSQSAKVSAAARRFSANIAVSPEVAAYAATQAGQPVSGNGKDPRFRDLVIHTPSKDPKAVALEALNEVTGRI